jgi:PilZ domain-containing protein
VVSVKEFLSQEAVEIAIGGQYTLPNWFDSNGKPRTFACRTSRVSPFRMMVAVPVVGKVGERISSCFGDFGKLEGHISDVTKGSFLLELAMSASMREKFASKLTWLDNRQNNPLMREGRKHARIIPAKAHSTLTFGDGSTRGCFVIDMSVSGVAVSADLQPHVGMPLAVGACVGRVVRLLPDGFAVKFIEQQNRLHLERLVMRRTNSRSSHAAERLIRAPANSPASWLVRAEESADWKDCAVDVAGATTALPGSARRRLNRWPPL